MVYSNLVISKLNIFMIEVNYLAIVVSAVAAFAIGFVWHGPLFGKTWAKLCGVDMSPEAIAKWKAEGKSMMKSYVLTIVGSLIMAYVLSHFITMAAAYFENPGIGRGLSTAFWAWLAFIAPVTLGGVLWEGKSWKLWFINAGYYLVTLLAMGAILAGWM